jgi:hypothetical protein
MEDVRNTETYKNIFLGSIELFAQVAEIFGISAKSVPDVIMSARCDGQKIKKELTTATMDRIARVKAAQQMYVFGHDDVFRLGFSFSAAELLNFMIQRINGNSRLRFLHWSGHDGNILGFLGYLGVTKDLLPPYGSYITTELWKKRRDGYVVRFIYNGEIVSVRRMGNRTVIPFEEFREFVTSEIPLLGEYCGLEVGQFQKNQVFAGEEY